MKKLKAGINRSLALTGYQINRINSVAESPHSQQVVSAEARQSFKIKGREFELITKLPGFLDEDAYQLFKRLGQYYDVRTPSILEIGIFCGRSYLALGLAFKEPRTVVGVDPFFEDFKDSPAFEDEGEYLENASEHLSREERLDLLNKIIKEVSVLKPSLKGKFDVREETQDDFFIKKKASEKYNIAHVDGEHTFQAVFNFMDNIESSLKPRSLIIVDDFLNPGFPGISEAVHTHPSYKKSVFPVIYGFNKAVLFYKPAPTDIPSMSKNLSTAYKASKNIVRTHEDGSILIQ